MSEAKPVEKVIMLDAVRLSYPHLFQATQYQGKGAFSYSAAFHIVPGSNNDKKIRAVIEALKPQFGKNANEILKSIELNSMKYCYMNGVLKGLDNVWVLTAKRKQEDGKPLVLGKNPKQNLSAEDGVIYGGCFVNAKVELYAQSQGTGAPGLRCGLIAVQFFSDGESFGGASQATADGFGEVEGTEEDDDPTA
jgi:hypothetical protein